jgi:hypothetical protein
MKRLLKHCQMHSTLVAAVIFALILFVSLLAAIEWRYHVTYSVPSALLSNDMGFRLRWDVLRCENAKGQEGRSDSYLGQCGRYENGELRRTKFRNHDGIAAEIKDVRFKSLSAEWLSAQHSRWENVELNSGTIWNSDFSNALFTNVIFDDIDFRGLSFDGAHFKNVTFRGSDLMNSSFRGAVLEKVTFENSTCSRWCDFRSAKMRDTKILEPFNKALFNLETELPFPYEEVGIRGFQYSE